MANEDLNYALLLVSVILFYILRISFVLLKKISWKVVPLFAIKGFSECCYNVSKLKAAGDYPQPVFLSVRDSRVGGRDNHYAG